MLSKIEYQAYKDIVESKDTKETMASVSPDEISKLGGEMSVYYARLSNEYATVEDEIMNKTYELSQMTDDKGKTVAMSRAEMEAEIEVNNSHEVSRREIKYLMAGIDKISFACSARVRSFSKEGNF